MRNTKSLARVPLWMNPIGTYFRFSDETLGMIIDEPEGIFSTWNLVGVSASLRVPALVLAKRAFLTFSTRS